MGVRSSSGISMRISPSEENGTPGKSQVARSPVSKGSIITMLRALWFFPPKKPRLEVKNISVYHIPASREVSPVERLAKTIIHDGLEGEDGRFHQLVECVADFRIMDIII